MSVRIRQSPILTNLEFLYFLIQCCVCQRKLFSKKFISASGTRNMAGESIPKIINLDKIGISGENIVWCPADHMLFLWFRNERIKKEHVIHWQR